MRNNLNKDLTPDPAVLNDLLSAASKKLGCTPEQLRKNLESGNLGQNMGNQSNNPQLSELNRLMNDPAAIQKLMNDPKAAALLKKLSGK